MKKCGNSFFQCLRHTQQEKHGIRSHNSKLLSENSAMQTEKQKASPGNPEHQKGVPEHITDVDLLQMVQAVSNGIDTRSSDTCTVLVLWLQQLNVWSQCVSVAPYCHSANAEWHSHPPVWFWSPLCSISLDECFTHRQRIQSYVSSYPSSPTHRGDIFGRIAWFCLGRETRKAVYSCWLLSIYSSQ